MRRIVVFGSGFGGFRAARVLQRAVAGRRHVQLTVVSDRPDFVYTPLLAKVATGELDSDHVTFPLRGEFDPSTELLIERIEQIDIGACTLRGESQPIPFDYLLVACGAEVDWQGHSDWRSHALTLHGVRDARKLQETIADALAEAASLSSARERRRQLTFVIGGAGPTGVELAAELAGAVRRDLAGVISEELLEAFRIVLVEEQSRIVPRWPDQLGQLAREQLSAQGVELRVGTAVVDRSADAVELSTGEVIEAEHFVWCGGVRPSPLVEEADFEHDEEGRIAVDQTLSARGLHGIYAIGDAAGTGAAPEQNAQVAVQQAPVAAENIVADMSGRGRRRWEHRRRGLLLSLGRDNAVAHLGETAVDGRAARALYRLVHTALMPTALKKAQLFKDWLFGGNRPPERAKELLGGQDGRLELPSEDEPR